MSFNIYILYILLMEEQIKGKGKDAYKIFNSLKRYSQHKGQINKQIKRTLRISENRRTKKPYSTEIVNNAWKYKLNKPDIKFLIDPNFQYILEDFFKLNNKEFFKYVNNLKLLLKQKDITKVAIKSMKLPKLKNIEKGINLKQNSDEKFIRFLSQDVNKNRSLISKAKTEIKNAKKKLNPLIETYNIQVISKEKGKRKITKFMEISKINELIFEISRNNSSTINIELKLDNKVEEIKSDVNYDFLEKVIIGQNKKFKVSGKNKIQFQNFIAIIFTYKPSKIDFNFIVSNNSEEKYKQLAKDYNSYKDLKKQIENQKQKLNEYKVNTNTYIKIFSNFLANLFQVQLTIVSDVYKTLVKITETMYYNNVILIKYKNELKSVNKQIKIDKTNLFYKKYKKDIQQKIKKANKTLKFAKFDYNKLVKKYRKSYNIIRKLLPVLKKKDAKWNKQRKSMILNIFKTFLMIESFSNKIDDSIKKSENLNKELQTIEKYIKLNSDIVEKEISLQNQKKTNLNNNKNFKQKYLIYKDYYDLFKILKI